MTDTGSDTRSDMRADTRADTRPDARAAIAAASLSDAPFRRTSAATHSAPVIRS